MPAQTPVPATPPPQPSPMLERIRASTAALPPAEQRVAQLLLQDPRAFASTAVADLAKRSGVSKPTVVRFCRSVGYGGLADFKIKLAGSVNEGVPFVHRSVHEGDSTAELMVKVIDNAVAAVLRFRHAAQPQRVEQAIGALALAGQQGRRIEFYGVGNSSVVAQDAQHKFFRLGVMAAAISDSHTQVMSATMLGVGDCAVVFSNSGRSKDLIDVADIARTKGATVVLVTASGSPMALMAAQPAVPGQGPVLLLASDHSEDADRYSPMVSRLLHLLMVDVLTTGVALRLGSAGLQPMLREIKRNLRLRRYVPGDDSGSIDSMP